MYLCFSLICVSLSRAANPPYHITWGLNHVSPVATFHFDVKLAKQSIRETSLHKLLSFNAVCFLSLGRCKVIIDRDVLRKPPCWGSLKLIFDSMQVFHLHTCTDADKLFCVSAGLFCTYGSELVSCCILFCSPSPFMGAESPERT